MLRGHRRDVIPARPDGAAADRAARRRHRASSSSTRVDARRADPGRSSRASRCCSDEGCDAIVAFGGGSVMDAAKVDRRWRSPTASSRAALVGYFQRPARAAADLRGADDRRHRLAR
ncbi:MAG: iron-containing alcohol dehydrogenase [Comamonadaceae bacterium]|nr:iron-containing alcohol dehydrogenase [Comamonadaceae bacterium]